MIYYNPKIDQMLLITTENFPFFYSYFYSDTDQVDYLELDIEKDWKFIGTI